MTKKLDITKELVVRSTGYKFDICLRDRISGEIEYLYMDVDPEWLTALTKDCIEECLDFEN